MLPLLRVHMQFGTLPSPPTTMSSFISRFLFKVSRHSSGATTQTETVLSLVREETEKKEGTTYDAGSLFVSSSLLWILLLIFGFAGKQRVHS